MSIINARVVGYASPSASVASAATGNGNSSFMRYASFPLR
jgi:hypothetical protein